MFTIFPCYAPVDAQLARELAVFLERGTGACVFLDEGEIRPGQDLIAKVDEGRMADVVLALLSPESSPASWPLEAWQQAFWKRPQEEGIAVAPVLCRECRFPPLLRKRNFLSLADGGLAGFREVKRWVLALRAPEEPPFLPAAPPKGGVADDDIEALAVALADRPGTAAVAEAATALAFAARHGKEFEAVLWLSGPAGDLAAQLGLKAGGPLEEVEAGLRRTCVEHRLLVIPDGVDSPVPAEGLTSVLRVEQNLRPAPESLAAEEAALLAAMAACGNDAPAELAIAASGLDPASAATALASLHERGLVLRLDSRAERYRPLAAPAPDPALAARQARAALRIGDFAAVRRAFYRALPCADWTLASELGRRAVALALAAVRRAEAFEILSALAAAAETRDDPGALDYCAREQAWILEEWGRIAEAEEFRRRFRRRNDAQGAFAFMFD